MASGEVTVPARGSAIGALQAFAGRADRVPLADLLRAFVRLVGRLPIIKIVSVRGADDGAGGVSVRGHDLVLVCANPCSYLLLL